MQRRVLITGAPGSGTTTLGRALAEAVGAVYFDADDYDWLVTEPPYKQKQPPEVRLATILAALAPLDSAVVGGSILGWGIELEDSFSLVVFLTLPAPLRLERIRERELARHGTFDARFLSWAAQYDRGYLPGPSRERHEKWLRQCTAPVLRLRGDLSVNERLRGILAVL